MKNCLFLILAIIVISGLILSGCSSPSPSSAPAGKTSSAPAAAVAQAGAKTIELKVAGFGGTKSSGFTILIDPWTKAIQEATGGKVHFTAYMGEELTKQSGIYDAVETGLADIGIVTPDITPGRFPRAEINVIPGIFPNAEVNGVVMYQLLQKYSASTEMSKIKILFMDPFPPMGLYSTKPIQKLEDLKGLKIGVEGDVENWMIEAMGGTGVRFSLPEVYTNLERNLMDAIFFSWEGAFAFDYKSVTKCQVNPANGMSRCFIVLMNQNAWNSLPADVKAVFEKNSGVEQSRKVGMAMDGLMNGLKKSLNEFNTKVGNPPVLELSEAEQAKWQAIYNKIQDKWMAERGSTIPAKDIVNDAKTMVKDYKK